MQVADGVHRLTGGVCNFYLIEDGGKLVLVDAGAPRDWDLLVRTLAALDRGFDNLDAVLITHAHSDHTGVAERARTTAPAPVWVHHADAAVARGAKPAKNDGRVRSYLLLVEERRVLLTGDVLATRNPLTGRDGPQFMPSGLNRDTPQALRSLDVLDGDPS